VEKCFLYIQKEIHLELRKKPLNFESELKSSLDGNLIPRPNFFNFQSFLTSSFTVLFPYLNEKEKKKKKRKKKRRKAS